MFRHASQGVTVRNFWLCHNHFMALRHNGKKFKFLCFCVFFFFFLLFCLVCFFFFFGHIQEKNQLLWKKKIYIYIKRKDKTLMQYQINFTRRLSFTKKGLQSVLVEAELKLGLYKECLAKNISPQVTSISGRII